MRRALSAICITALAALLPFVLIGSPPSRAGVTVPDLASLYVLDPDKSEVYVQVFKDPTAAGSDLSHDHVIRSTGWTGSARFSPTDSSLCEADWKAPVSGLRPDLPELRKKVGYTVMLTDAQQAQVGDHMRGSDQLDASRFGELSFHATSCSGMGPDRKVTGALTIHGVSHVVQIPVKLSFDGLVLRVKGGFTATHADFGLKPYSAFFGALRNGEVLSFSLDVVGSRSGP